MLLDFFGLKEQPFGVTPDPRFLYLSSMHRETLASLFYGIEAGRGFMSVIARPGMGKTTLLFHLLRKFRGTARTAFVFQTQCNPREFLRFLLADLGVETDGQDLVKIHEEFNRRLLEEARAGRRFIVVIDEAQNLEPAVLETLRLLSNFETSRAKLMQIILAGQPQLADKLNHPSLNQLRQRISVLKGIDPLRDEDIEPYITHRLTIAGFSGEPLFTLGAYRTIAELSEGIPRNINNICFNALSLAFALGTNRVDASVIQEVAADLDVSSLLSVPRRPIISAAQPEMGNGAQLGMAGADETGSRLLPFLHTSDAGFRPGSNGAGSGNSASFLSSQAADEESISVESARAYMKQIANVLKN